MCNHVPCSTKSMQVSTKQAVNLLINTSSYQDGGTKQCSHLVEELIVRRTVARDLYTNCFTSATVDAEALIVWAGCTPSCPHWLPTFPRNTCLQLLPPLNLSGVSLTEVKCASAQYVVDVFYFILGVNNVEKTVRKLVENGINLTLYWDILGSQALLKGAGTRCARFINILQQNYIWKRLFFYFAEYFVIVYCITIIETQGGS